MSEQFDKLTNLDNLYKASRECRKTVSWKESSHRYEKDTLLNLTRLSNNLKNGTYKVKDFTEFHLNEYGKVRHIRAMSYEDNIVQKCLCDQILTPEVAPHLIHTNGASIKGKGISFTRDRLMADIRSFVAHHGTDGYIAFLDVAKFFDNIDHEDLMREFEKVNLDDDVREFLKSILREFRLDCRHMSSEQIAEFAHKPFNSLTDYNPNLGITNRPKRVKRVLVEGKCLARGMSIGAQVSQVIGVYYPSFVDHFCTTVCGIRYYGRYMDDIWLIHQSFDFILRVINAVYILTERHNLFINKKKTRIVPITVPFKFMQTKYKVTDGKIVRLINRKTLRRERSSLRFIMKSDKFASKDGLDKFMSDYKSWRNDKLLWFDTKREVNKLDKLVINYIRNKRD